MIRTCLVVAMALALSGCCTPMQGTRDVASGTQDATEERAAVDAIAGTYAFTTAGTADENCRVTLNSTEIGHTAGVTLRSASVDPACRARFAALADVRTWAWTGGGSISLFGGEPTREVAHFSPVQDATGVFL